MFSPLEGRLFLMLYRVVGTHWFKVPFELPVCEVSFLDISCLWNFSHVQRSQYIIWRLCIVYYFEK